MSLSFPFGPLFSNTWTPFFFFRVLPASLPFIGPFHTFFSVAPTRFWLCFIVFILPPFFCLYPGELPLTGIFFFSPLLISPLTAPLIFYRCAKFNCFPLGCFYQFPVSLFPPRHFACPQICFVIALSRPFLFQ